MIMKVWHIVNHGAVYSVITPDHNADSFDAFVEFDLWVKENPQYNITLDPKRVAMLQQHNVQRITPENYIQEYE
jgi:hypothetical protein